MTDVTSVYVSETSFDEAMKLVNAGLFTSFADMLSYSMRFVCDIARIYGITSLPKLDRRNIRKVNVRIPRPLIKELQDLNFSRDIEIFDLAIQYYVQTRK